ncbi:response regulator [Colwellia sp. 4_MG-2023]|jgi:two-component system response regulator RegA|uniref:response regulator transcription factor n=1 Tax=unclassified Colwellia TaxID=196834 RepID=UPI0026E446DA|nr:MULTISPECIES: response regulator [unclassified Colwellia]MDO6506019.1 response regulator [Colwellia sp. 5_MG-2023]MDO6554921.1 response regulator [Colwellia sp. 4_MG-2023]
MTKELLLVEDDTIFANTVMRRLTKHGFNCSHVDSNSEALLACRRHAPDYILLDMKLAQETTLGIIAPLRKVRPQSRIILLTGFASIATAVDAIKLGADDYLSKPLDTQTLLAALNESKAPSISTDIELEGETLSAEQAQWQYIQQVLKANNGNISATARQLSMHRRTLQRKLQKKPQGDIVKS